MTDPGTIDLNELLAKQVRDIELADENFRAQMDASQQQFRTAINSKLNASPTITNPDLAEIIALVSSVPKIAPAVLKKTKELLARIQAAVDAELNQ